MNDYNEEYLDDWETGETAEIPVDAPEEVSEALQRIKRRTTVLNSNLPHIIMRDSMGSVAQTPPPPNPRPRASKPVQFGNARQSANIDHKQTIQTGASRNSAHQNQNQNYTSKDSYSQLPPPVMDQPIQRRKTTRLTFIPVRANHPELESVLFTPEELSKAPDLLSDSSIYGNADLEPSLSQIGTSTNRTGTTSVSTNRTGTASTNINRTGTNSNNINRVASASGDLNRTAAPPTSISRAASESSNLNRTDTTSASRSFVSATPSRAPFGSNATNPRDSFLSSNSQDSSNTANPAPKGPRIVSKIYTDLHNRKESVSYTRFSISIQDLNAQLSETALQDLIILPKKGKKSKTGKKIQFFNTLGKEKTKEKKKKNFGLFKKREKQANSFNAGADYQNVEGFNWVGN